MSTTITIDPRELMDTAVLLGSSAVELADLGSTLRSCTGCAMPPQVRSGVDALVAVADRIFDDMAIQLRNEAANLAQRAIIAANDMLTAAGYPPLPGTSPAIAAGPTAVSVIGGSSVNSASLSTSIFPGGPNIGMFDDGADGVVDLEEILGQSTVNMGLRHHIAPQSTMTIGGNSWGPPVVASAGGGANSSVGGSTSSLSAFDVGGSWTPSSLEITITNPDGTPSGFSTDRLEAMLSQSARSIRPRPAPGPIDTMKTNFAVDPLVRMMQNDNAYTTYATNQNLMGNSPLEQHQSPHTTSGR